MRSRRKAWRSLSSQRRARMRTTASTPMEVSAVSWERGGTWMVDDTPHTTLSIEFVAAANAYSIHTTRALCALLPRSCASPRRESCPLPLRAARHAADDTAGARTLPKSFSSAPRRTNWEQRQATHVLSSPRPVVNSATAGVARS